MTPHLRAFSVLLMVSLSVASAFGRAEEPTKDDRARFDIRIPFDFAVGNRVLPTGLYRFEQILGTTADMDILLVRGLETRAYQAVTGVMITSPDPRAASRLVFQRYGNQSFLSEIWIQGKRLGLQLRPSVLQNQIARTQPACQFVSLRLTDVAAISVKAGSN